MIKIKHIFSLKYFLLILVIKLILVMLYINTIAPSMDYLFVSKESASYELNLKQFVSYESNFMTEGEVKFEDIINDLEDAGAKIYYSLYESVESDTGDGFEENLMIDRNFALKLAETNMVKIVNENGTIISDIQNENSFATCDILYLDYSLSCKTSTITIHDVDEIMSYIDVYLGDASFDMILSQFVSISYDGDLTELFNKTFDKYNISMRYQIIDINDTLEDDINTSKYLIKLDKQNFVALIIIWFLSVILSSLVYLKSRERNISILLLLGYSRISILFNIISISLLSVVIPYIILKYNKVYLINYYIIIDIVIMTIIMTIMYVTSLKTIKEKAKERL